MKLNHPYIGVFGRKNAETMLAEAEVKDLNDCHRVGTFVKITEVSATENKLEFVGVAHRRIEIQKQVNFDDNLSSFIRDDLVTQVDDAKKMLESTTDLVLMVDTKNVKEVMPDIKSPEYKAIAMEIVKTMRDIIMNNALIRENLHQILGENLRINDSPSYLADLAASITSSNPDDLQMAFEEKNVMERLKIGLDLLKKEKQILDLQAKISQEVEQKIKKQHRTFMLQEQLKAVKKELGMEKDDKDALTEKFRENLAGKVVPEHILQTFETELEKLGYLEKHSSEFS